MEENTTKLEMVTEKRIFDDYFKVDEGTFKETLEDGTESTITRLKLERPDAVAVLIYNADDDTVVLTKQHRYPIEHKVDGPIFEIVAGKMEGDEDPVDTAIRETKEEVGYEVIPEKMIAINSFFASAGYSSEMVHLFAARVESSDRVNQGGGVEGEHENIEIYNVPVEQFFQMVANNEIVDAKTLMGAQALWHLRNQHVVEAGKEYIKIKQMEQAKITAEKVINDPESQEDANETTG